MENASWSPLHEPNPSGDHHRANVFQRCSDEILATAPDLRGLSIIPSLPSPPSRKTPAGSNANVIILTSPEIQTRIRWDELIASWNVEMKPGASLKWKCGVYPRPRDEVVQLGTLVRRPDATTPPEHSAKGC